jgi:hypothetical protein
LSITTSDESAGTATVEQICVAVPPRAAAEYRLIVMSAFAVPSTLATISELILKTFPLDAALLTTDVADVEVKSTIKRYGKMVTISGEHQLSIAKGKKLFLAFMRFENSLVDECIDSTKAQLVRLGAKDSDIEGRLEKMGYQQGRSTRKKGYLLQEAEIYEITNEFPKITPASFVEGVTPPGIEQIRYEIDLLLIKPYSTLDSFSP